MAAPPDTAMVLCCCLPANTPVPFIINENIYCLWRLCLLPLAFVVDSDCVVAVVVFSYLVLSYSFTDAGTRPSPRKPHVIIDRKSTRLNYSHVVISYAFFFLI